MIRYRPDPAHPRRLTTEEARRLDEAPIDYSDIPPLSDEFFAKARAMTGDDIPALPFRGEEWLAALLLQMVMQHCEMAKPGELDSYAITANADAMRELDGDLIEITEQFGRRVFAKVTPKGRAMLDRLRAELEEDNQTPPDFPRCLRYPWVE
jgi:hypothetical protein